MKKGAFDFVEKPAGDQALLDKINAALAEDERRRASRVQTRALEQKLELLTPREREVLELIRAGKTTHGIATALEISQKTVQVHRTRVLEKIDVGSVPELLTVMHQFETG
jgi:RNA polymerase sigma factor (sigma-70 family)